MAVKSASHPIRRVDVQVSIFTAIMVIISCLAIFAFHYRLTYDNMIGGLVERVESIHAYEETFLDLEAFSAINTPEDMETPLYKKYHDAFFAIKQSTGVRYLYTAKQTADGSFVYGIDGLDPDSEDFRRPGDPIEPEIIPELERALAGEDVLPDEIKDTGWGKIFIAYLPIHDNGAVVGVVGIEFEAEAQYDTYRALRIATPIIAVLACILAALFSFYFFRRISNPTFRDLSNTDYLTELKSRNAFETDMQNLDAQHKQAGLGIILIDLNNLKAVNDALGHESGDLYIKACAQAIREEAVDRDVAYRVGGDEFVLCARAADYAALEKRCGAIRARFQALCPAGWSVDLSLSMGCALYDAAREKSLFETYRRADDRMYEEKQRYHSGRT